MIFELWEADELRGLPRITGIMQHKEVLPAGRCRAGSRHAGGSAAERRQVRFETCPSSCWASYYQQSVCSSVEGGVNN